MAPMPPKPTAQDTSNHCHPAMVGIQVSPVHGRHCICNRCLAQADKPA
jgi:hypothetical protein